MTIRTRGAAVLFFLAGTVLAAGLTVLLVVGIDRFITAIFTVGGS